MLITKYLYDNAAEFVLNNAVISGSQAQLGLIDNPGQVFQQTFDNDTGFTYNNALAEFTGGLVRQVDQTPANSVVGAIYSINRDASWNKEGSITAVINGTPSVVSGRLQCFGAHGVRYPVQNRGQGAIKFKYRPNYTGAPAQNINLVSLINDANDNSRVQLTHSPSGNNFRILLINNSGTSIIATASIGAVNLVAGTTYEVEMNWDNVAGTVRVFLDGALLGTLSPGAWTHGTGAGRLHVGAYSVVYNVANAEFDDVVLFSAVQHTSGYTAGYSLPATIYSNTTVQLPNFTYTGIGTIQAVEDSSFTEVGAPRYIVAGLYWDGANWVTSDGTYAQANDSATVVANLTELVVTGADEVPVSVVFPASNSLSSVDSLSVTLTGQKYSPLGTVETVSPIVTKSISGFSTVESAPANTAVTHILLVDDVPMWWNGSAWVTSDGTAGQSNTAADVTANIATLVEDNKEVKLRTLLTTTVNNTTPNISEATFTYDFGALAPADATKSNVYGFIVDIEGNPIQGATVKVRPDRSTVEYREAAGRMIGYELSRITDDEGFFSFNLIRSSEFEVAVGAEMKYQLEVTLPDGTIMQTVGGDVTTFVVPDQSSTNITDQIAGV